MSHGALLAIDATAAPRPRLTRMIGLAQQTSDPDVVNSNNHPHFRPFSHTIIGLPNHEIFHGPYQETEHAMICGHYSFRVSVS